MIDIVKQIIQFNIETWKTPSLENLKINDESLLNETWNIFVTLYKDWEIVWSSWNVVDIEKNIVLELIWSTISALNDIRFTKINISQINSIRIRIDKIIKRTLLWEKDLKELNPLNTWILTIKKDYTKLWVILPNISPELKKWEDYISILTDKLNEDFKKDDYIIYEIETENTTNF